jgi:predicted nucleic acid-binding protein
VILYLDTSAYLKLFFEETGSERVAQAVAEAWGCATHLLTYAEMRAGFARGRRMGRLTGEEAQGCAQQLDREWEQLASVVEPADTMIRRAGNLADSLDLRGYDSVHLAAAEALAAQVAPAPFRFAAFDDALIRAAASLGLSLLDEG